MSEYLDIDAQDLLFALGRLKIEGKSSYADTPDDGFTIVAANMTSAQVISGNEPAAKDWLRKSQLTGTVKWYPVPTAQWEWLAKWLEVPGIGLFIDPDSGVLRHEVKDDWDRSFLELLLFDLGGGDFGKPPMVAVLSNTRDDGLHYADTIWVSRNPGALIQLSIDDPRYEGQDEKHWRSKSEPNFWCKRVSTNAIELIVLRLARLPSEAQPATSSEGVKSTAV